MNPEHGWDYNTNSGPPQSWDHGKDAQSYYHVIDWLDLIMKSDTAIGNEELRGSTERPSIAGSSTADSSVAGSQTERLGLAAPASSNKAVSNTFSIIGLDDGVKEVKKVSGGDGWMAEDAALGIVEDGSVWRGIKTFCVPIFREIQISEEPNVGSESGTQAKVDSSRGGYRGRYRGRGNYRGRGTNHRGAGGVSGERWAATRGW